MTTLKLESPTLLRRRERVVAAAAGLLLGLSLFLAGCQEGGPGSQVFVRNNKDRNIRVAVLPFTSPANSPGAGDMVTSTIITYLLSTGVVEVVEPGLVDRAMRSARYVPQASGGLDLETLGTLQQQLQVDAYMVGQVDEFGEVRVGPDSYPSISFSARLIRASDASIIWAASISRTGADRVKVFDIGRVSSIGKLTKSAVAEMAESLRKSSAGLMATPVKVAPQQVAAPLAASPTAALAPIFLDESSTFGQADFKALLPEVPGLTRGQPAYSKHFHDTVTTTYATDGASIAVRLVDYLKADAAAKFVQIESPGLNEDKFGSLPAFSGPSSPQTPGIMHLNVVAGRFGLFLAGPESASEKIRQLAIAIIAQK